MAKEKQINLLLIEDSPTETRLAQEMFHEAPHEDFHVITATTVAQGLEYLSQEDVDVVLLDLGLADSQGLDTFRLVHEHSPQFPIVVLTVSDNEELGLMAVQEGAQRFLTKDVLALGQSHAEIFTRTIRYAIEQKRADAALEAREKEFRAVFARSPIAKIRYDAEGYPVEINDAAVALIGVPDATAIRHVSLFSTPRISNADKERLHEGEAIRYEQQYNFDEIREWGHFPTTRSGVSYVDAHIIPLLSETGVVKEYIGEFVDVTERKHAEEEREGFARFPEENPDPVLRIASSGHVLFANAAAKQLLKALDHLWDETVPAQWLTSLTEARTCGQTIADEIVAASRVVQIRFVPVADEDYVNVYGTDITLRTDAEDALQRSNKELSAANATLEQRVQKRTENLHREVDKRIAAETAARKRAHYLDVINRVIEAGNEALNLSSMLSSMLDTALELMAFDGGLIFLLNEADGVAELQYANGCPPAFVEERRRVPISLETVAHFYRGEPLFMEDYPTEVTPGYDSKDMTVAAGVPLIAHDKVIGHFGVISRQPHCFTDEERDLLVTLGREAGTVIARMQAEEEVKEHAHRAGVLNEIIHVINQAPDLPTLYERALIAAVEQLGFESGRVAVASDGKSLDTKYAYNTPPEVVDAINRLHIDSNPFMRALYQQRKLVVLNEAPPELESYRHAQRGAVVGIPFASEGDAVGGLALYAAERRAFTPDERELFEAIGREFGTAVTKLEAKAQAEEYARRQEIVNDVIKAGNEADTLQTAIHAMLQAAMELMQMTHGSIYLLNETERMIELQHARGFGEAVLNASRRFPLTTSYYPRVYAGQPVFLDDYAAEGTKQFRTLLPDLHVMAIIPLSAQNRVIGNYVVSSSRTSPFANEERDLLIAVGQQAGTVIARLQAEENARKHAQQAEILRRIIIAGNQAESLQSAVAGMVSTTMDALDFDSGGIFLREDDAVTLQYARGYAPEQRTWAQRIPLTQRRVLRVMAGTPWISDDYQGDVSSEAKDMNKNVVSMATVPLVAGDAVIGFYQLADSRKMRHFTAEDVELLVSVGQEVGTVIARLQAEEALKDNEARSRDLIERSFDAVIIHSDGKIRFANTIAARVLRAASPDALVGKDILDIPTAECRELGKKRIESVYGTQVGSDPAEMQYNALDGSIVDVEVIGTHTMYAGKPAVYVAFRDISERKRTEEQLKRYSEHLEELVEERSTQLKKSEKQYRTLVETANNMIFTLDTAGTITFVNGYGARFFGYASKELVGQNVMIIIPEVDSSGTELTPLIDDIVAHPDAHVINVNENVTKDGRRVWVNWVNKPLTDEQGRHIGHLAIGNDVTEQKRTEKALHDAQRLAGIGETAAMIGHDLRNPLQGLQYIVDLQRLRFERIPPEKRGADDWTKEVELFDRISEQVFYMDKIVADLQDYARPITPEPEKLAVSTLINDVLSSLPHTDHVKIISDVSGLEMMADPHLMHRVFANLMLNAMQAMPEGGTLTITASRFDDSVAINLHDTGVGIPEEMKGKLFLPLSTGKAKGTGLGLAVVKRVVDAHGGTITFESGEGNGTTFTVTLPSRSE